MTLVEGDRDARERWARGAVIVRDGGFAVRDGSDQENGADLLVGVESMNADNVRYLSANPARRRRDLRRANFTEACTWASPGNHKHR